MPLVHQSSVPAGRSPRRHAETRRLELHREPVGEPAEGEVLVKVLYISLDPAMRGWMNEGKSYIPPVGIGEVMRAGAVGRVIASQASRLRGRRSRVRHAWACRNMRCPTARA